MKKVKYLVYLFIILIFISCNYENLPVPDLKPTNKPSFINPYSWVGEGHNWIMDKFDSKEVDFSLQNSFELTKQFMISKGMEYEDLDNRRVIEKTDDLLKLCFPGFPDSVDNSKREMSLEEIVYHLYIERLIGDNSKESILEMARIIDSYSDAREKLADYCESLKQSVDDTTRTIIFALESIYSSSYEWWDNKSFGKINKVTVPILVKADVAGGVVAGGIYAGQCLLDPNCRFSWSGLAGGAIAGAAGASFFKKIGWW
ncbi:MAG: hypothetical protein QMD92_07035 [bacterium]|nr:hypothetical protein [bacterium]